MPEQDNGLSLRELVNRQSSRITGTLNRTLDRKSESLSTSLNTKNALENKILGRMEGLLGTGEMNSNRPTPTTQGIPRAEERIRILEEQLEITRTALRAMEKALGVLQASQGIWGGLDQEK